MVAIRHLVQQQRATREAMGQLAAALAAGPSAMNPAAGDPGAAAAAHRELAQAAAGRLRELAAAPQLDATVSRLEGMLGPVPTVAEARPL